MDLDAVLREVADAARPRAREGEIATYIESLAHADPESFALALVELDGTEHVHGDADVPFAMQSISKVFSLVLAMRKADEAEGAREELWRRVGVEPSGDPFNSLVQLEREQGKPRNPMINAGALVVDDVLVSQFDDPGGALLDLLDDLCVGALTIDDNVYGEEALASNRNLAIANLIAAFGNLDNEVEAVLDTYVRQCAVSMTTRQLARAVRFLANDGCDPASGKQILRPPLARRVAAIMLTCGTYDSAGQFAFDVGFPCKSGVAGGIVGVVRDRFGVCVWSPPLESSGNSLAGHAALHDLAERLDLTVF